MNDILLHQNSLLPNPAGNTWRINLEQLRVADAQEETFPRIDDGDEPYFAVIGFRSRFNTLNSTQVFINDFTDEDWANEVDDGDVRTIPQSMGSVSFNNINLVSADELNNGVMPELVGAIAIAFERDTSRWSDIYRLMEEIQGIVNQALIQLVEEGQLDLTNLRDGLGGVIEQVRSRMEVSFLEKIGEFLTPLSNSDDYIGLHSFWLPAIDADLASDITFPTFANATVGALSERSFSLDANPIEFRGDGARYEVGAAVRVDTHIANSPEAYDEFGSVLIAGNFNGASGTDLAIGVQFEDIAAAINAGAVNVAYGTNSGLTASNNQIWHQGVVGLPWTAETNDLFGTSLAAGDFNRDGRDDLAIGVSGEDNDTGAVNVLYGSAAGLGTVRRQDWSQGSSGIEGAEEVGDRFGSSLTVGDFDGDGYDDLAVGAVGEAVGSRTEAGAVNILYGSGTGLSNDNDQIWQQDVENVQGNASTGDRYGSSLAAGDFNGDGRDDLAIGVTGEDAYALDNAGAVNVLYGTVSGLTAIGDQLWNQDSNGVLDTAEANDRFGSSLATGDFNGDNRDDLAIGVTFEDIGTVVDAGAVSVLHGSDTGLTAVNDQFWHQNNLGAGTEVGVGDRFGAALAVGDFNQDGFSDLAIGVPYEEVNGITNAGAVNVLYGSTTGLTAVGRQVWHQNSPFVEETAESGDRFGSSLTAGDFNNDGYSDLAIGVPGENVGSILNAGATQILYGSATGLSAFAFSVLDLNPSPQPTLTI
ncbi:FG-GAP repeat protein [Oscillatoria sp. FACHB-1407]|uniref:FG-GAP repeat protein n=1 Tax=Oscillatoria sp. FACHB-1407 TaxID=2692847 RepID=UPI001684FB8E|nr:FG-GAP repeat protein [Oscillatoria sp. FACHB-1407]MBD2463007.1 FG-GAP repeat protein [Oscillatoria sp. FACHB-1407]